MPTDHNRWRGQTEDDDLGLDHADADADDGLDHDDDDYDDGYDDDGGDELGDEYY
jgi:hypothetical protein